MNPLEIEIQSYQPAFTLQRIFPKTFRTILLITSGLCSGILLVVVALFVAVALLQGEDIVNTIAAPGTRLYVGFFLISFVIFFKTVMLTSYFNSFFYRGIEYVIHKEEGGSIHGITYDAAFILKDMPKDVVTAFVSSSLGREVLLRSEVKLEALNTFLSGRKDNLSLSSIQLPRDGFLTLSRLGMFIFEHDTGFKSFLEETGVVDEVFVSALSWVERVRHKRKHESRWWGKEQLGRISGIGKDWSYGGAYLLERFCRGTDTVGVFSTLAQDVSYADDKVAQLETILARRSEANAILVGEEGVGTMDVVVRLSQMMGKGDIVAPLAHKHLLVFDAESFLTAFNTKQAFEENFTKLLSEAEKAGDVVMVIENLASFLSGATTLQVDAAALIDPYLTSSALQFIATSDPVSFHEQIETKSSLANRFEKVSVESPDFGSTRRVLENIAGTYEKGGCLFTYSAIQEIAESADRYITYGVMPDKAVSLLVEVAAQALTSKQRLITKTFVDEYVSTKTGIPSGEITQQERTKLLDLENVLHKRVIGQDNAVTAVSSVMRRVRAGIQDEKRPMGSFLFLGSTGVGKTETAKALAYVFFGVEDRMLRLDMSEFSGADAVARLIGGAGQSGILANLLKDKPYGVLLLDEFEKASEDVHNLFLQIIEEGFFSDVHGGRISARNVIVIATSNAGSRLIIEMIERGENPADKKDEIISTIIHEGVYKPELINRFDGVIIFEPLTLKDREKIAQLLLEELRGRIKKKGYTLVIDEVLVGMLATKGFSPEFGARPMRRVMQDVVEEIIARKIIEGNLKKGDKIWFYERDFEE